MVNVVTDPEAISTGSCNSHSIAIDFVYSVHKIQSEHKGSLQRKVVYIPVKRLTLSQTWMQKKRFQPPPHCPSVDEAPPPVRGDPPSSVEQKLPTGPLPAAGPRLLPAGGRRAPRALTALWVPVPLSSRRLTGRTQGACGCPDPALGPNRPAVVKWGLGALGDPP